MKLFAFFSVLLCLLLARVQPAAAAMTVTSLTDLDMGGSLVPIPAPGGTTYNTIGTNGAMTYASGFSSHTGADAVTAGQLRITGATLGDTLTITCDNTDTLTNASHPTDGNGGPTTLAASNVQFDVNTTHAPGSASHSCAGVGSTAVSFTYGVATTTVYFGMRLNVEGGNVKIGDFIGAVTGYEGALNVQVKDTTRGTTVNATVVTRAAFYDHLVMTSTGIDLGDIAVAGTVGTGTNVQVGTDGSYAYHGNFANAGSTPVNGTVTVSGITGSVAITAYCSQSVVLGSDIAGNTSHITFNNIQLHSGSNRAAYTTANCLGLDTAVTATWTWTSTNNALYLGGQLDGSTASGTLSGSYSTAGGSSAAPIEVILVEP